METSRLLAVVVFQLNMKEPHITFARKFDLIVAHAQTLFSPVGEAGNRAEKRKWLRHCPAASNVGSSARSFKMIGILRGKKPSVLKVKK